MTDERKSDGLRAWLRWFFGCRRNGHSWGPWIRRDENTVFKNGWMDRWCKQCGVAEARCDW